VDPYEHEWEPPRPHWLPDKRRFAYEQVDRGHQRLRVIAVEAHSGEVHNLVDEKSKTFIWTAHNEMLNVNYINWLEKSDEMIYVSERDGWRHLYLIDTKRRLDQEPDHQRDRGWCAASTALTRMRVRYGFAPAA
jgi:Tol biopolymer transport system component